LDGLRGLVRVAAAGPGAAAGCPLILIAVPGVVNRAAHACLEKDAVRVDNVLRKEGPPPQAVLEAIRAKVGSRPSNDL
jgi:hypothetical protein